MVHKRSGFATLQASGVELGSASTRGSSSAMLGQAATLEVSAKSSPRAAVVRMANKSAAKHGAVKGSRRAQMPFASLSLSATQVSNENVRAAKRGGAEGVQLAVDSSKPADLPFMTKLQNPILLAHDSTIPKGAFLFLAGGCAGAISKTITAPLDRVKLLMQTQKVAQGSVVASTKGGFLGGLMDIARKEGVTAYWKGNIPQLIRILPYSATQLSSYEFYKSMVKKEDGSIPLPLRLLASASAGMTATAVTYPLDIIRLRMAVDPDTKGLLACVRNIWVKEGPATFYKGLLPACASIAPYVALNFTAFDILKQKNPEGGSFQNAFLASAFATSICYPMDTIRRQLQMKTNPYAGFFSCLVGIASSEGVLGFYRGWVPNLVKNLPNSSIRLTVFDSAKGLQSAADEEYEKQVAMANKSDKVAKL